MSRWFQVLKNRIGAVGIPKQEEIELYGADGEEAICQMLRDNFEMVIRNPIVPHNDLYLEKDFMVVCRGVPFVVEVKFWKGEIGTEGENFTQVKANGQKKVLKSPVGTTNQFISKMKRYYGIDRWVYGIVVFADPNSKLNLPDEIDNIALLDVKKLIPYIKSKSKAEPKGQDPVDGETILRCTRFYDHGNEFCKGIVIDNEIPCETNEGTEVTLDTNRLRYLSVKKQAFRLRDRLCATFDDGSSEFFVNRDTVLTVNCLDGSYQKIALSKVEYVVF